jgi:hypothetical protein
MGALLAGICVQFGAQRARLEDARGLLAIAAKHPGRRGKPVCGAASYTMQAACLEEEHSKLAAPVPAIIVPQRLEYAACVRPAPPIHSIVGFTLEAPQPAWICTMPGCGAALASLPLLGAHMRAHAGPACDMLAMAAGQYCSIAAELA